VPERVADQLTAVPRPGLGEQVVDVALDRRAGDPELTGELGVRQARGDRGEHLDLARGEAVQRRIRQAGRLGRGAGHAQRLAAEHGLDQPALYRRVQLGVAGADR
jgi:hypothetical protein